MSVGDWVRAAISDALPGRVPNEAARPAEGWRETTQEGYELFFAEFNDQGRPFYPGVIGRILDAITSSSEASDVAVYVFVHGWKHGAQEGDDNLANFRRLLHAAAHVEHLRPQTARKVVGIYVAWRGLTWHWLELVQNATFWSRKEAALRVALGSVRELLARLRRFRADRKAESASRPRLVLVGHSFGGLILYSAIAEYLIESVATPANAVDPVEAFSDLVILINPAFEAARYDPLHAILVERSFLPRHVPVFLSITAKNDWATGVAFPLGRHFGWTGAAANTRERTTNFNTMGHVSWMRTHDLTMAVNDKTSLDPVRPADLKNDEQRSFALAKEDADFAAFLTDTTDEDGCPRRGWTRVYSSGVRLSHDPASETPTANPFWVVRADANVVNGHNGIFGRAFIDFLRQVLDDTTRATDAPPSAVVSRSTAFQRLAPNSPPALPPTPPP